MPYKAFACPECDQPVFPENNIFCNNCGINLSQLGKLEKKTFYHSWEICPSCKKGGGYSEKDIKLSNRRIPTIL
jgi:hypothetical protein